MYGSGVVEIVGIYFVGKAHEEIGAVGGYYIFKIL